VIAVGRDGNVLAINPAASKLLGYPAGEAEGEAVARILRAPRGESHVSPGACAAPEEPREVEAVTRSGDVLPVGLRLLPLESRDGTLMGTLALFQDLREQKALEEQWRRRDRLASLGALAAGVAHEIRNPLAGIGTSAQVMKRRLPVGDPRAQFIDLILEEVSRLDRIVTGLLQFAKPTTPRLTRQSILPALEKALTLVHEVAVRQNVLIQVERADVEQPSPLARLSQVLRAPRRLAIVIADAPTHQSDRPVRREVRDDEPALEWLVPGQRFDRHTQLPLLSGTRVDTSASQIGCASLRVVEVRRYRSTEKCSALLRGH